MTLYLTNGFVAAALFVEFALVCVLAYLNPDRKLPVFMSTVVMHVLLGPVITVALLMLGITFGAIRVKGDDV